ncbi:MAG: ATP-binding protein [Actinomycetota bacterium]|nr:ATP-binding protein [Actinomycetota bacterium]
MAERVIMSWSCGKDSALALHEIQKNDLYSIQALLTTVSGEYERVSMHGVRRELLRRQASSLGMPSREIVLSPNPSNREYESLMREALEGFRDEGVSAVVFGDIYLRDVRRYREENMQEVGMRCLFPLWGRPSSSLAHDFIRLGFKAVITCVDSDLLDGDFAGRHFDERLLSELPPGVDPGGENGEFHTFVFDGPPFKEAVNFRRGEVVLRDGRFYFCDLIPARV